MLNVPVHLDHEVGVGMALHTRGEATTAKKVWPDSSTHLIVGPLRRTMPPPTTPMAGGDRRGQIVVGMDWLLREPIRYR